VVLSVSLADAECLDLSDIVNTDRYPLHDPDSPRLNDLVAACRAELAASGSAVLHDFLRPEALERARNEGRALAMKTYFSTRKVNAYYRRRPRAVRRRSAPHLHGPDQRFRDTRPDSG